MKQKTMHPDRPGFALVISLTLMSFLVLLVVSLALFTRLETQTATSMKQRQEARQNALTGLNIAIGELQKYAGPDQRVTARADLQYGEDSPHRYWTGVYGNSIAADYEQRPEQVAIDLTNPDLVDEQGSSARLLSWLVSGNESIPFNPTTDVGTSGQIINPPLEEDIPFLPNTPVNQLADTTAVTETNLTIYNVDNEERDARILLGRGATTDSENYVAAPLVELHNSDGVTTGGYAWWVGDEGVKARANLPLVTDNDEKLNAFLSSSRAAVELMSIGGEADEELDGERIDTLYDPDGPDLTRIDFQQELPFASTTPSDFSDIVKYRYHDLTTHSMSVLADAYAGGLKRDLSALLHESYVPDDASEPTANENRLWPLHANDSTGYAVPTWKHLRSFAQTRVPTTGADAYTLRPILPAHDKSGYDDHVGVGPVITYFSLGFHAGIYRDGADQSLQAKEWDIISMNLYPLVVIWNPYNFTLKAPPTDPDGGNYEVGFYPTWGVRVNLEGYVSRNDSDGNPVEGWHKIDEFDFQKDPNGQTDRGGYIRFRLDCPDIPPGESLIFSIPYDETGELYTEKNVLKNVEPEINSYVSAPFRFDGNNDYHGAEVYKYNRRVDSGEFPGPRVKQNYAVKILPGEENAQYRVKALSDNAGISLRDGKSGAAYMYVGAPVEDSLLIGWPHGNQDDGHDPSYSKGSEVRQWYNAHQNAGWDEIIVRNNIQQEAGQLENNRDTSEPSFVMLMQALFSGEGQNAQLNTNQHMFTTRWIAQGNMRAVRSARSRRDVNYNPLFTATAGTPDVNTPWQKFIIDEGTESNRASAGLGHDWIGSPLAPQDAVLFEFPYQDQPLLSIGQLQHANLSLIGSYPSYPIGNSLADYHMPDNGQTPAGGQLARTDRPEQGSSKQLGSDQKAYYDISYLLNRTLWDQYFFSSVPATGETPEVLPNPRHLKYNQAEFEEEGKSLKNPDQVAAGLMLNGGFNINSTSEQAWRAVLGATNQLAFDPETHDPGSELGAAFSRFSRPTDDEDPQDIWEGYRVLSEEEIAQLARAIVEEIRNRGPFTSLADFVNRRLVDNPTTDGSDSAYEHEHFTGTLQAAIERASTYLTDGDGNASEESAEFPVNDATNNSFWAMEPDKSNVTSDLQGSQFSKGAYEKAMIMGADVLGAPHSNRSAFAPKYLTQADILSTIGSTLSARSDTFVIRAYGESVDPLNPEDVRAQAWCEAVVQRYPEYIDDTNEPEDNPTELQELNKQFGRKFKVLSFRWLSPDEV